MEFGGWRNLKTLEKYLGTNLAAKRRVIESVTYLPAPDRAALSPSTTTAAPAGLPDGPQAAPGPEKPSAP